MEKYYYSALSWEKYKRIYFDKNLKMKKILI